MTTVTSTMASSRFLYLSSGLLLDGLFFPIKVAPSESFSGELGHSGHCPMYESPYPGEMYQGELFRTGGLLLTIPTFQTMCLLLVPLDHMPMPPPVDDCVLPSRQIRDSLL